ncbi:triacylglycerol lipase [Dietzia sp. SYD-A1]|uniref:esterase/lipase family protein n=1 Tax=Dietzia sp. SYD-A1 TaxID=2780141 RepID=UPI0018917EAF|nr:alpha/beta fold hydrolase [Dietzia sp. SYD-A1]
MIGVATRPPARPFGARRIAAAVAVVAVAVLLVGSATTPARAQSPTEGPLPVPFDISAGFQASLAPEIPPPGANDPNCRPTPQRPRPVVLVHPTFTTQALAWQAGAPLLRNAGYCVYTFTFGNVTGFPAMPIQGLGDIRASGLVLQQVVDRALAETGADAVDLVGHSQGGGILADYYLTFLGGSEKVHTKVGISPSTGTRLSEIVYLRSLVPVLGPAVYGSLEHSTPALIQQVVDSPLATEVYPRGPEGIPGVRMYSIVSQFDQIVTPFVRQFYSGDVTNIELQAGCAEDLSEHVATLYSERVWLHVLNALAPAEASPVPCFHVAPYAPWVR